MKKKQNLRLCEDGRLRDGSMRFVVRLPKALADPFEQEMKLTDRKKMPMARYIIATYFRERYLRKEFEEFIQLRTARNSAQEIPHFGDGLNPQHGATLRKASH